MKKAFCFSMMLLLLAAATIPVARSPASAAPVSTSAEAAALIDVTSGRFLYSHNGDKRMRIASTTKIMTAIVAIERGNLSDMVTTSKGASGKEGSSIYLKVGQEMSLEHLLYGLMLRSGNDAATAIAEHVGGSEEGFVYMMNEKAAELGMSNTHFMNPHGLDHDEHYSTANDMAILTAYALKNSVFQEIVKTKMIKVPNTTEDWDHVWYNKNKMLTLYEGADGVKTGYTKRAKRCLVSSATRNGQQLAVVTLNDPRDWADHSQLLDYGFSNYKLKTLMNEGDPIGEGIMSGGLFRYALQEGEAERVTTRLEPNEPGSAAYRLGDLGTLYFLLDGTAIGSVPLRPAVMQEGSSPSRGAFQRQPQGGTGGGLTWGETIRSLMQALLTGESEG